MSTSYPEAGPHVIRDVDAWSAFWAHLPTEKPMPEVDFDKATLAVVIVESEPKMPVRPFVGRVEARDQTAFVHWRAVPDRRPHINETIAARHRPFVVIGIIGHSGQVRFVEAR